MAVAMPKVDPFKAAVVVLVLLDIGLAYPVYETFNADPKSDLKPFTGGAAPIKIDMGTDTSADETKTGLPPRVLLAWDPFKIPKGIGQAEPDDTDGQAIIPTDQPVPTDNIHLYGIINFNGQYRALVSVGGGASTVMPQQGGQGQGAPSSSSGGLINPPEEVRKGMILPGTQDIKAADIRRDGILLTQPGAVPTFLPLTVPGISGPKPWFRADDAGSIRGRLEMSR